MLTKPKVAEGRGIFAIHNESELEDAFSGASSMAQASFGNPAFFVEKFLADVRHIEIRLSQICMEMCLHSMNATALYKEITKS